MHVQLLKFYLIKKIIFEKKNNSLTRVFNTRVQLDTRIKYTCQIGRVYLICVSNWARVLKIRVY
jgi:hypothetical protein